MNYAIIKKAVVSEKSFQMAAEGKFCFIVDKKADKKMIAEVVAKLFNIEVLGVNIVNYLGKKKQTKKGSGRRSDYKKAIITAKKGQKIDLFEVEKEQKNDKQKQDQRSGVSKEKASLETTVRVREKKSNYQKRVAS